MHAIESALTGRFLFLFAGAEVMQRSREETAVIGVGEIIVAGVLYDATARVVGVGAAFTHPMVAGAFDALLAFCGLSLIYHATKGNRLTWLVFGALASPLFAFMAFLALYTAATAHSFVTGALMLIPCALIILAIRWREKPAVPLLPKDAAHE